MPRDNKTAALAGVRLFSALSHRDLAHVARASEVSTVSAGEVLVREGEEGRDFYLILDGSAVVRRNGRKLATLGAGDYFGELALLDGGTRSATVEASVPSRLLVLTGRQFASVLEDVPALARRLLVAMAARLRDADAKAVH